MRISRPVVLRRGLSGVMAILLVLGRYLRGDLGAMTMLRTLAFADRTGAAARKVKSSATNGVSRRPERRRRPGAPMAIVRGRRPATAALVAVVAAIAFAVPAAASSSAPPCPDTVIPNAQILPSAVGCWNAIAVQSVRLDTAYPPQGLLYMGYVQGAVYDAVTKIEGRYVPTRTSTCRQPSMSRERRPTQRPPPRPTRC